MNIYSLEYFEQKLPVDKVRPPYHKPAADGARLAVCEVSQSAWNGEAILPPEGSVALLAPCTVPGQAETFLQRLGMQTQGGRDFAGVLVDLAGASGDEAQFLLRAWRRAFDGTALIAKAEDTALIAAPRAAGLPFGLLLNAAQGTLAIRWQLAKENLQNVWQTSPVFLLAAACPDDAQTLARAMDSWHVLAADVPGAVPGTLLVRRVTYPKTLAAGGAFPVRLWLQNVGKTPVYGSSRFELMLAGEGGKCEVSLSLRQQLWPVGDTVYNEIAQLPGLIPETYELYCRVRREDGRVVPFHGGGNAENGWVCLGKVTLGSTPQPELYNAWDGYYPDGYYPLEDPKLPE